MVHLVRQQTGGSKFSFLTVAIIYYMRLAIRVKLTLMFVLVQQVQSGKGFLFFIARVPETAP